MDFRKPNAHPEKGENIIHGGAGRDRIGGDNGDDAVFGEGGNDFVSTFAGEDILHGGAGNDDVDGGNGKDKVSGEGGNDIIGDGENRKGPRDILHGGGGNDILLPRNEPAGADVNFCGGGRDTIYADKADLISDDCERVEFRFPRRGEL